VLELFAFESTPGDDPNAVPANLPAHLAYQCEMEAAGRLALAGPLSNDTGEQMKGAGLIIYRASSLDQARNGRCRSYAHLGRSYVQIGPLVHQRRG